MDLTIRLEKPGDYRTVEELVREAFWNLYLPGCSEHFVLHNLRAHADFIPELDFVAEKAGRVVGQIAYSRGLITGPNGVEQNVACFGPVSVLPGFQKQGIGSAMINHSLAAVKTLGFSAVCIYGDPRYYHRFGFRCAEKFDIATRDGKFAVALLAMELRPGALANAGGRFIESSVFDVDPEKVLAFDTAFPVKEKAETESQREFRILVSLQY